jgi:hypothetical protein
MQFNVPVNVIVTQTNTRPDGEDHLVTTIFIDALNRRNFYTLFYYAPEILEEAVLTGRFNIPGHNHSVSVTPYVRQEVVYGDLVEEFHLEITVLSDVLLPEDLPSERDYATIQLASLD